MFRCRIYVKTGKKGLAFQEVIDDGQDMREHDEFGKLSLVVETDDRAAMARLVRRYKEFRREKDGKRTD